MAPAAPAAAKQASCPEPFALRAESEPIRPSELSGELSIEFSAVPQSIPAKSRSTNMKFAFVVVLLALMGAARADDEDTYSPPDTDVKAFGVW